MHRGHRIPNLKSSECTTALVVRPLDVDLAVSTSLKLASNNDITVISITLELNFIATSDLYYSLLVLDGEAHQVV